MAGAARIEAAAAKTLQAAGKMPSWVAENRPSAGGSVGIQSVAKAVYSRYGKVIRDAGIRPD